MCPLRWLQGCYCCDERTFSMIGWMWCCWPAGPAGPRCVVRGRGPRGKFQKGFLPISGWVRAGGLNWSCRFQVEVVWLGPPGEGPGAGRTSETRMLPGPWFGSSRVAFCLGSSAGAASVVGWRAARGQARSESVTKR